MRLIPANAWESQKLYDSELTLPRLIGLATTLPICRTSGRNELYGREHAFYAVADTQVRAIEYLTENALANMTGWFKARRDACNALAAAGYSADYIFEQEDAG